MSEWNNSLANIPFNRVLWVKLKKVDDLKLVFISNECIVNVFTELIYADICDIEQWMIVDLSEITLPEKPLVWIKHNRKRFPDLNFDDIVKVKTIDGVILEDRKTSDLDWTHRNCCFDIAEYAIIRKAKW